VRMEGDRQTLVVAGNGMMSFRLCRKLVECEAVPGPLQVVVFGEESRPAYDRVRLTELFAGRSEGDLCLAPADWYRQHGIDLHLGDPVTAIDREARTVRSASGAVVAYDRLVLATGSRPFVPRIPGTDLPGVLVYRTVDDLRAILDRARGASRAAVIGGGLLGLEAARAAQGLGLAVHVVEASPWLLPRQLDETGSRLLREKIEALGVSVHAGARTAGIEAREGGLCVTLEGGERIEVDMVLLAAGIRARDELGRAAGLDVAPGGGVVVDDHLVTSDERIFAAGECASHRGVTYGLAVPGYRMIDVLVDNLVGGDAVFQGSDRSARLKLLGVSVASLGRYQETEGTRAHTYLAGGVYRKLVVCDDRLVGALAVGEWEDLDRVREAIEEPVHFSFWDLRRFRSTGTLFLKSESPPVYEWPAEALVCGCLGVRRGALDAVDAGCASVEALSAATGAGTMCGSCRPLLAELVRRMRVDSVPASAEQVAAVDSPVTLRCSGLPDAPAAPASPRGARVAILPSASPEAWMLAVPSPREELPTLPCAELAPLTPDPAPATAKGLGEVSVSPAAVSPVPVSPVSVSPVSAPMPSSLLRSESSLPLLPISVPPSRLSGRPSGRLPPPSLASPLTVRDRSDGGLLATAALGLAGSAALVLVPAVPPARSFRGHPFEALWTGRAGRQASGYATVALVVAGLVLSLRKRWKRFPYGGVSGLRVLHGALGALALGALACHTGLASGERLNRLLALDFVAASALGGAAAGAAALGDPARAQVRRILATRAHLLILIPLPVLLALHVLGAYYF
jgi:NADPH-dependent 2,4-dienoyl-CoA reductase/sulfur reductase-like enzyme/bacterioferritin-associated ferredoxin